MTSLELEGSAVSPAGWAGGATPPLGWADGGAFRIGLEGAFPLGQIGGSSSSGKSGASSCIMSSEQTEVTSSTDGFAAGGPSG
eukprot:2357268-Pyramimonas_sp.AAC.1